MVCSWKLTFSASSASAYVSSDSAVTTPTWLSIQRSHPCALTMDLEGGTSTLEETPEGIGGREGKGRTT